MQNTLQRSVPLNIQHFALAGILPDECTLAVNITEGIVTLTALCDGQAHVVNQVCLTDSEMLVFLPLVASHPYYCPYEDMYASFFWRDVEQREKARDVLNGAVETGAWDEVMRPVRNVLSRTRIKTRLLNLEISSILETGYVLMSKAQKRNG